MLETKQLIIVAVDSFNDSDCGGTDILIHY
jgi:hypothetical protein